MNISKFVLTNFELEFLIQIVNKNIDFKTIPRKEI
jgi:hypothetical protein